MSTEVREWRKLCRRFKTFMQKHFHLILAIVFSIILFVLPLAYPFMLYRQIPSIEGFILAFKDVGTTLQKILFVGLIQGLRFFIVGTFFVVLLFIGTSLVFDVSWRKKQIWGKKSPLHIFLGYYIMIEILFPMLVNSLLQAGWHPRLWGTVHAPTLLFFLLLLSLSILLARVVSKLPMKIGEEQNLGYFIISIYISYAFFEIMGRSFSFLGFWKDVYNAQWPGLVPFYANAFFILSLPAIFSLILMILDRIIIPKVSQ